MDLVGNYDSMIVICLLDVGIVPVHRVCRAMNVQNMRFGIISYDHICTVNVCTDFASTYTMWPTYNTIRYDTMQCNAMQYDTIQYIQYIVSCVCVYAKCRHPYVQIHMYMYAQTPRFAHTPSIAGYHLGFL